LLIEDNQSDVVLVRDLLEKSRPRQFQLHAVTRLAEGLTFLETADLDLVLVDLALPDSQGIDTFLRVRAEARELPVVVLSGNANDAVALQAMEQGAQDYVVKGVADGELLARIMLYAIARHRLTAQLQSSERRLRLMAEQLPALLWTTDSTLRITSWRGRDLVATQLENAEVIGKSVGDVFQGDAAPHLPCEMHKRAVSGETATGDISWSQRWYHAHVEPLCDSGGAVVGTIGVALDVTRERRLRKDVEAAHQIQQHMLPASAPSIPGFDIAGHCFPATACSGDFFDYIPLPRGCLAVVLADVSGHGFGPAIMASAIRSYLRTAAVLGNQVHEMLALSNRLLASDSDANPFASVFCARLDANSRSFQFASAGHPAYLVRHTGAFEVLAARSVPIGVRSDEIFTVSRPIHLHRGDVLLLASDGVFETRDADRVFFGVERMIETVRETRLQPAREIVGALHRAACDFAGDRGLEDDVTAVVIKRPSAIAEDTTA
jgi:DNA-binding response OmpR family regulator